MPSSTVVAASYWVVDQLDGDVTGFTAAACGPSCQLVVHVVGPPEESPEPLGVPSLFQRTEPAVVVTRGERRGGRASPHLEHVAAGVDQRRIELGDARAEAEPEGLLISATCLSVLAPLPVSQDRLTVTRRKSSPWISGSSVPAEAGTGSLRRADVGGRRGRHVVLRIVEGQMSAVTVYLMPRRITIHGEGDPVTPPLA